MTNKTRVNTAELGSAIRRRREQHGLSLRDVADETGVSASTLSRIENGTGKPHGVPARDANDRRRERKRQSDELRPHRGH